LLGLVVAGMLAADMSTNSSYMLAWSSVIFNDILKPFRKKPPTERQGLAINRVLVGLIGVFLLLYGLWYPLKGDLWVYLQITGSIYLASMAVLMIGACYWKRANSWGAMAALIVGATLPISFLVAQQLDSTASMADSIGPYYAGIATYVSTAIAMVLGSLLKPNPSVNHA
jgi:SSS family solute:Na+ symporter